MGVCGDEEKVSGGNVLASLMWSSLLELRTVCALRSCLIDCDTQLSKRGRTILLSNHCYAEVWGSVPSPTKVLSMCQTLNGCRLEFLLLTNCDFDWILASDSESV
jgi:hypothetical protein